MLCGSLPADEKPGSPPAGPLSPSEELATFRVPKGFHVELVASEPDVVDPVAMAFDEEGRLLLAEMRGYPNEGVATGTINSGKVRVLEDREGNGKFTHSTLFARDLRFPTAVMPWKGGVLVAVAPDLVYLEDRSGAGKADHQRTLYNGFDLSNIQQLVNGLQWGMDNWVYGMAGNKGGRIRSVERPDAPAVELFGRGIRFHPETPASLEPTSGGGQYGLAADDWERWFTNTNSQHLRHIVLPDHYLQRNRRLAVSAVTIDIPDHGAACQVHRISPFEAWRVERTRRRREGPDAQRFPSTELVPGGYITSACSPVVYTADRFPEPYRGNTFICDPANNLVHRDVLEPHGATFLARRGEADSEFLASTDTWFRPVFLTVGPDGALYVLDFYREVIETPLSLPEDMKKKLNLESRGRGRIWRIVPNDNRKMQKPALKAAPVSELVRHLADANSWWRLTAQRLLVERQDRSAVEPLEKLFQESPAPLGRAHALWTLEGLQALRPEFVEKALKDHDAGVREQALRLAEPRMTSSPALRRAVAALAEDKAPRVRFQLAFTLGQAEGPELVAALARVARRDAADPWTQTAVLSSAGQCAPALLETLARDHAFASDSPGAINLFTRLAALIGAGGSEADLARALALVNSGEQGTETWRVALLEGLGQGLQNSARPLPRLWEQPPPALKTAVEQLRPVFQRAETACQDARRPVAERVAAARLLGYGPFSSAGSALAALLTPQTPGDLQLVAVRALGQHEDSRVAALLLEPWAGYSPSVRREVVEALFARPDRVARLLTEMEKGKVSAGQLEPIRLQRLREYPDLKLRQRARTLLAGQVPADRRQVLEEYRSALELKGDRDRGKAVFKKNCATCHRLENEGTEVGPDLLSALRNKTPETLLIDILDPSREVDPRYLNYQVTTTRGKVYTGILAAETASSITLRRAERAEDTILRDQIEKDGVQASNKSLMPEGLEKQLGKQDVADVIAYLLFVGGHR